MKQKSYHIDAAIVRCLGTLLSILLPYVLFCGPCAAQSFSGPLLTQDPEGVVVVLSNSKVHQPVAVNLAIGWVIHGKYLQGYRAINRRQWRLKGLRWWGQSGVSRMSFKVGGGNAIHVRWGQVNGTTDIVGLLQVKHPLTVVLACEPTWPGYMTNYQASGHSIKAVPVAAKNGHVQAFWVQTDQLAALAVNAPDLASFTAAVVSGKSDHVQRAAYACLVFHLQPGKPLKIRLFRQAKTAPGFNVVKGMLRSQWDSYIADRASATGDWGDFISPIASISNMTMVYVPTIKHPAATVARDWCMPDGCVMFEWDSFFNAALLSLNDSKAGLGQAGQMLRGLFHYQMPDGMICNFSNWERAGRHISTDRSEPPVGAMCVWQIYQRWPSKALLQMCYKPLVRFHDWWFAHNPKTGVPYRDGNKDGLLEFGTATRVWQNARYESGMDDSPMYQRGKVKMVNRTGTFDFDDVGLSSLWAADAMYLSKIAAALGKAHDAAMFESQWKTMGLRINAAMWDSKLGIYCNRYWSASAGRRVLSQALSPTSFYPMIADIPNTSRTSRMIKLLRNPKYFWGKWVIPTISRNNPAFKHQEYWRGDIWGPTNYLVFQGLLNNNAPDAVIHAVARKSVKLFMRNWTKNGVWSENYLATTGIASHDPHYSWGALLPLMGLQAICDTTDDDKVRLDGTWNLHATLRNIPIFGYRYTVEVDPGRTVLLRHGRIVAKAVRQVLVVSLPCRHIP